MALPTPPSINTPIPNNPFYAPLNPYICGPYYQVSMGEGIDLTSGAAVPSLVNDVQNVLAAGPGIALSTLLGVTTISATGGGGSGTVTSIATGTGLTGGPITTTGTIALDNTAVTPGAYTNADITVDAQGRITAAANGTSAVPATPTVEGVVYGCTDCVNYNYGLGDGIFGALTTGTLNIAVGSGALATTDTGTSNTAVGIGALYSNTAGNQNVAVGQQALFTTTGINNTAVGSQALQNTTGNNNTALGNYAGNILTTGSCNIIIGDQAGGAGGGALDTGNCNIVIGNRISVANNAGDKQLAIGMDTFCWLSGNSTGAIKPGAGIIDCTGSCGTAGKVLMSNGSNAICWGSVSTPQATQTSLGTLFGLAGSPFGNNVASGWGALANLNTGLANTAFGQCALYTNAFDSNNTAVGANALAQSNGANGNTAIGNQAGFSLTTGDQNTIIGNSVDVPVATGSCQLAIGFPGGCWLTGCSNKNIQPGAGILDCAGSAGTAGQVLTSTGANAVCWGAATVAAATPSARGSVFGCTTGGTAALGEGIFAVAVPSLSVAIGCCALRLAQAGSQQNIAIGYTAGSAITTGYTNTLVGSRAGSSITTGNGNVVIGAMTGTLTCLPVCNLTTECNRVVMSSTAVTGAYIQVAWTAVSDARDKTNVTALPVGLDFVNKLNPVSFQFKESRECALPYGPTRYGFLAQEVLEAEGEKPVIVDIEDPNKLKITQDYLNPVFVKAIQELSAKVDSLQAQLDALKANG